MSRSPEEELQLTVPENTRPGRADKLLARLYPDLSRTRWQKLFQEGRVWLDDRCLSQTDKLSPADTVQFSLPAVQALSLEPVPMDLAVLYEDEHLLVLDKEAGRVVHPGAGTGSDTLVHGLLHHCRGSLEGIGGVERPGIVHRLDKETTGVMVVAKSEKAFQSLSLQFADRVVKKHYTALACGVPSPAEGTIEAAIGRHPVHRTRMACRGDGRAARTDYRVDRAFGSLASRVVLRIHTGRTHQIRVHMKELGHPLLGDELYGYKPARFKGSGVPRVMLHATRLELEHPDNGKPMAFEAPLPEDFRRTEASLAALAASVESH